MKFGSEDAANDHIRNNLPNGIGLEDCEVIEAIGGFSVCVSIYPDERIGYEETLRDIGYSVRFHPPR